MKKYLTWKLFFSRMLPLIALTTATFFYFSNLKEREPVWNTTPRVQIFNKDFTKNSLIILNKDSTQITDDIYAQELMIWNAGKIPIELKDVRVPIRLVFSDSVKLIEYEIIEEKASNKNNFSLIQKGDTLELKWKYFDPNFGIKFRHIYSSKNKKYPNIEGAVLGNDLKRIKQKIPLNDLLFVVFISILLTLIFGYVMIQVYREGNLIRIILSVLFFIGMVILLVYSGIDLMNYKPTLF